MVTVAIIGIIALTAAISGMGGLSQSKTAQNTSKELRDNLAELRNHATSKGRTARMVLSFANGGYTMNTSYSAGATDPCNSSGTWTTIQGSKNIKVHSNYNIDPTFVMICFSRDGSASGTLSFNVAPNAGITGTTYTLTTTAATGFIDVTKN